MRLQHLLSSSPRAFTHIIPYLSNAISLIPGGSQLYLQTLRTLQPQGLGLNACCEAFYPSYCVDSFIRQLLDRTGAHLYVRVTVP